MSTITTEVGRHTAAAIRQYVDETVAAEILGLKPRTMQEWRRRGIGPAHIRVSPKCVRYDVRTLDTWMAERERTSTSDPGGQK